MDKIKIKLLTSIAGNAEPAYDQAEFGYAPGQIVEVHPNLAAAWIGSGLAEAVPMTEAAVLPDAENAMKAGPAKGRRKPPASEG